MAIFGVVFVSFDPISALNQKDGVRIEPQDVPKASCAEKY